MAKLKIPTLSDLNQPIIFAFAITFTVVGMIAVFSWFAASFKITGLMGLLKGGVAQ